MLLFHKNTLFWPCWLCLLVFTVTYSPTIQRWIRSCYNNLFRPWRGGEATSVPPATRLQVTLGFAGTLRPYCRWMELAFIFSCW